MTTRRSCLGAASAALLALAVLLAPPAKASPLEILMPVEGVSASQLTDTFLAGRGKRRHEAIDILAPRGTPVVAAADGTVERAYFHRRGGLCVYQEDADGRHTYLYAHLDHFAPGIKAGSVLKRGDLVGYVGSTGNVHGSPHLHFAVYETRGRPWWLGKPVNPYPLLAGG